MGWWTFTMKFKPGRMHDHGATSHIGWTICRSILSIATDAWACIFVTGGDFHRRGSL